MSKETHPPLVGRNPLVHLAGIAQAMEREYADAEASSYKPPGEVRAKHEWAAQSCALFDLVESRGFDGEALAFYRERLEGYRVELALRYKQEDDETDDDD